MDTGGVVVVLQIDEEVDVVPVIDEEVVDEEAAKGVTVSMTEPPLKVEDNALGASALNVSVVGLLQFTLLFTVATSSWNDWLGSNAELFNYLVLG